MTTLTAPLAAHHKECDDDFAGLEEAVSAGDWAKAEAGLGSFSQAILAHFGVEEDRLFPAFEQRTGMAGGPTRVMRMEHSQMRSLLDELSAALAKRDGDEFLGVAETLLVLMQQHNMKEENMLYPMCDQALAADAGQLRPAIAAALAGGGTA